MAKMTWHGLLTFFFIFKNRKILLFWLFSKNLFSGRKGIKRLSS